MEVLWENRQYMLEIQKAIFSGLQSNHPAGYFLYFGVLNPFPSIPHKAGQIHPQNYHRARTRWYIFTRVTHLKSDIEKKIWFIIFLNLEAL